MPKLTPWDATDYLETEEQITAYYEAAIEIASENCDFGFIMHTMDTIEKARIRYGLAIQSDS